MSAVFSIYFFRDPDRSVLHPEGTILSPADGRLLEIEETECVEGLGKSEGMVRFSIFMNIFNVHVNRFPLSGKVSHVEHKMGAFKVASRMDASQRNERNILVAKNHRGANFVLVQIAGLVARRIVCRANIGDVYEKGERFGLIRFGSRVDIYLPAEMKIAVKAGERVKAGLSVLGYIDG